MIKSSSSYQKVEANPPPEKPEHSTSKANMEAFERQLVALDMDITLPETQLGVKFGMDIALNPGDVLTPTQVMHQPSLSWDCDDEKVYHTIVMNDLDAPSRQDPKYREWQHWWIANIPAHDMSRGKVMTEYIGAAPPKGSGKHRYVILLFRQKGKEKYHKTENHIDNRSSEGRKCNSAWRLAYQYNMEGPIAANFFLCEWDQSVPKIYEQINTQEA